MDELNKLSKNKRQSRRPMWRSLKMANNVGGITEPNNLNVTTTTTAMEHNMNTDNTSISTIDCKKSRLSTWLSQQCYEHENQSHYSPSWTEETNPAAISNLSLVSHVSSINNNIMKRTRSSSVPTTPTSPITPRTLMTSVTPPPMKATVSNRRPSLSIPTSRTINITTMIPPTSPTVSIVSEKSSVPIPTVIEDHPHNQSFDTLPLPSTTSIHQNYTFGNDKYDSINNSNLDNKDNISNDDEEDDDDDAYETASGPSDYSLDMCDRLDEINDNSDDSIYYINHQNNNIIKNNNDVNNIGNILLTRMDNEKYDRPTSPSRPLGRSSSTKGIYVNSIFDSMDPEVAQALLEWRRQSLLKIDWSNMFAVKSELWRSSNLFHFLSIEQQQQQSPEHCHQHQLLQPQQQHHLDLPSSQSSIATSLISLDFKGVSLDKAFRSYSTRIDYAKASVLEIDQALQVFAQLYWECNPTKLFRCAELVYIVIHSLMQLNTDIHAGKEHIAMDSFCDQTIQTILSHQASIPIMLFDSDGETTWQQQMTDCLKLLYKSIQRSSLLPKEQVQPTSTVIEKEFDDQPNDEQCLTENQLDTAFDNLFISVPETSNNNNVISNPTMSTTILQKQQQQHRRRRSNSLYSTPSWTLLRRRDTYRTKIGPYKEGPLSCQVNDEKWRICWVILQQGHLHIYHQHEKTEFPIHTTTTSTSSLTSDINNKNKIKKKFMHHIAPSSTSSNNSGANASHGNIHNNGQLKKTEPYQEVDIHLGNTFCEKAGAHVFILKLANGSIYIFDCGSESQVNLWIRDCNYWAAIETKIVPSRGISSHSSLLESSSLSISSWKRPPPPAGASVLDKIGQQKAIDAQLDYLQNELKLHLQQPGWSNSTWQDKKMYLELEIRKYQCYQNVIYQ